MRILAFVVLLAVGCATAGGANNGIAPGMTRDQVVAKLGKPDGYQFDGITETMTYADRLVSPTSWDRTDFTVQLRDGYVVGYGNGQVRQHDPVTLVAPIYPLGH